MIHIPSYLSSLYNRVNVVTVTPLTENLPGPTATKPGDMYVSSFEPVPT